MTRPIPAGQLARAARFLSFVFMFAITGAIALVGLAVHAQTTAPAVGVSSSSPDTIMGWVLKSLLAVLIAAAIWGGKKLTDLIAAHTGIVGQTGAQQMKWSLIQTCWLKAQSVASKMLAREKPLLDKILADGVVTADEFVAFKNAVLIDLQQQLVEEIPLLGGLMGGAGPVGTMLEGFATKVAHGLINGQGTEISPTPMVLPPAPVALAPAPVAPTAVAKSP